MHLTLIRHGIAENKHPRQMDIDRALTTHGRKKLLHRFEEEIEYLQSIDVVLCSTATRTRQTCAMLCAVVDIDLHRICYDRRIYDASDYHDLLTLIKEVSSDKHHCCLVGHNNSISLLASHLAGEDIVMKKWEIRRYHI